MIVRRTIISGSDGPIFATFSLNESILDADDRTRLLFLISQGTLPWQPNLCKNDKLPLFVALAYQNRMGYHYLNVPINRANDASISCKKFMNFGRVTPELREFICERVVPLGKIAGVFIRISQDLLD